MLHASNGPARSSARLTWTATDGERTLELGNQLLAVTIGRSSRVEVQLEDQQVSRRHAQLAWDGQAWVIRDLGSRNGTRVGAVHAGAGLVLAHGDTMHCGRVALRFSWPAGIVQAVRSSQPETITGSMLAPLTAAETTLLQELCRNYRRGDDPRTCATEPTSNAQLAERLRLSEDGVRQRLKRLYPKLGLSGTEREKRRELAAQAIELGIVRPGH